MASSLISRCHHGAKTASDATSSIMMLVHAISKACIQVSDIISWTTFDDKSPNAIYTYPPRYQEWSDRKCVPRTDVSAMPGPSIFTSQLTCIGTTLPAITNVQPRYARIVYVPGLGFICGAVSTGELNESQGRSANLSLSTCHRDIHKSSSIGDSLKILCKRTVLYLIWLDC